jgi:hypothetical protein
VPPSSIDYQVNVGPSGVALAHAASVKAGQVRRLLMASGGAEAVS